MKTTKLILPLILIIVILIILFTLFNSPSKEEQKEEILIGAILPLTGNGMEQGNAQAKAIQLVIDEANLSGGVKGYKIKLLVEDSKGGNPQEALIAYEKIKLSKKPLAVITWGSGVALALSKIMNDDQVIQMGVATASSNYSSMDDFTFRVYPDARFEGAFDANFVFNELNISNVSVIFTQNDYGVGSKLAFEKTFAELGGTISSSDAINSGAKDFRTQLIKLKENSSSLVFLSVYPSEGSTILLQSKELGLDVNFLATSAIQGPEINNLPLDISNNLLISVMPFNVDSNEPLVKEFREKYVAYFNDKPALYSSTAYDGARVILNAAANCDNPLDSVCVRNSLFSIKDFPGLIGNINFDRNGDIIPVTKIMKYENNSLVEYN